MESLLKNQQPSETDAWGFSPQGEKKERRQVAPGGENRCLLVWQGGDKIKLTSPLAGGSLN